MDQLDSNENDEDEVLTAPKDTTKRPSQHFQYLGGSGGTGKSWVIKAMQTVFSIKRAQKEMVIMATSGTAAAENDKAVVTGSRILGNRSTGELLYIPCNTMSIRC